MFKLYYWSLPLLLTILVGSPIQAQTQAPKNASVALQEKPTKVLKDLVIYKTSSASATALSINNTTISSQLSAIVRSIPVNVSESVKKGQLLAKLDCTDFTLNQRMAEAESSAARAELALAKAQLARAKELFDKKLTSQLELDTNQSQEKVSAARLSQRKIALEQARVDVARCKLHAPFDGVITSRTASEGQLVNSGEAIVSLVDNQAIELTANIALEDIATLKKIRTAMFEANQSLPVELVHAGDVVNSATRNVDMRFRFTQQKPLPGTAGRLVWQASEPQIPARYIINRDGNYGVFIADFKGKRILFHKLEKAVPNRPATTKLPLNTHIITSKLSSRNHGDPLP